MKRHFLIPFFLLLAVVSVAQQRANIPNELSRFAIPMRSNSTNESENVTSNHHSDNRGTTAINEDEIGHTIYDLQSNASSPFGRIYMWDDGTIGAVWTRAVAPTAYSDRGTGYNYFDGTSWGTTTPSRIESVRTGWPSYARYGTNGEVVISMVGGTSPLKLCKRANKGTGTWTELNVPAPSGASGLLWPRMVTGDVNKNTIHIIALTTPTGNGGVVYNGQDGAIVYLRSQDGGVTWDKNEVLSGLGAAYYTGFSGDTYAWAEPYGNVLAFVITDKNQDLILMKSTNNGTSWTKTIIWARPYAAINAGLDSLYSQDGAGHIAIDSYNKVHLVFGVYRTDPAASTWYPFNGGLAYWNEDMPTWTGGTASYQINCLNPDNLEISGNLVGYPLDLNNNGTWDVLGETGLYYCSPTSMPQISIDNSNNIFVSFAAITENLNNGVQDYRHLWGRASGNLGVTWNDFVHLTSDDIHMFDECVFPVVSAKSDDNNFYLIYQLDIEPGLSVRGDEDPPGDNYFNFLSVSKTDLGLSAVTNITVNSPNGGENWLVGSSHALTWSSTSITNVKIEYSTNNGTTWSTIISSTAASTGTYNWTVPNTPSTICLVKISDASNAALYDISNNNFSISASSSPITVTSPNGGENWVQGTSHPITWTSSNVDNVKIEYSLDNGSNWVTIINNTAANVGSYTWILPNTISYQCLVKISDALNNSTYDISDSVFAITTSTFISIISPDGGETWLVGSSHSITWNSLGVTNVKIDYSINNGVDWITITSSTPASNGSYLWTIPNSPSTQCKVKIRDAANQYLYDISQNVFTISTSIVELTAPNGNETWFVGSIHPITWTSIGVNNVKLEYTTNNGTNWSTITTSTSASAGSYAWTIPNVPSAQCKVRATNVSNSSIYDVSNYTFTIASSSVALTSPNGGELWSAGTSYPITWTSLGINNVRLVFTTDNGSNWSTITTSTSASTGSYSWTLPNSPSSQCKVKISNVSDNTVYDISNSVFTITSSSISITSPNGGENWIAGTSHPITWSSTAVTNVKIEYSTNNGSSWTTIISSTSASAGTYSWSVPGTPSAQCLVKISDASSNQIFDISNNTFSITTSSSSISVISPNGGENWIPGSSHAITWSSSVVNNVKIEYSIDNGSNWTAITTSTSAGTGTYSWSVPNSPSSQSIVKISDVSNGLVYDVSNSNFTISTAPSITVTSPNGGERWRLNSSHAISWDDNNVSTVNIDLSLDDRLSWSTIFEQITDNSVNWVVSGSASQNCYVRVRQSDDADISDLSNAAFTVLPSYPANVNVNFSHEFTQPKKLISYKIVGLPGNSNTAVSKYMSGSPEVDWISFWDNGNDENYMIKYDGSSIFNFSPGKAFWISSVNPFMVNETFSSVSLVDDAYAEIPLHSGWNIISSPFDVEVDWQSVRSLNSLEVNDMIYSWTGSWSTPSQLKPFEGYYFYNQDNLSTLKIPFEPVASKNNTDNCLSVYNNGLHLGFYEAATSQPCLQVNFDPESTNDFDAKDYYLPPGDFEEFGLRIINPSISSNYKQLFIDTRPAVGDGQSYQLQIINRSDHPVILTVDISDYLAFQEIWLVSNKNNLKYDLKKSSIFEIFPSSTPLDYTILIGGFNFVRAALKELWSKDNSLYNIYPNPATTQITVGYSVTCESKIRIEIINIQGKITEVLIDKYQPRGYYEVIGNIEELPKGTYLVRMFALSETEKNAYTVSKQFIVE